MKIELQKIIIPISGRIVKNEFTTYDPEENYNEELNLLHLQEDLLQIEFKNLNMTVDLGWYGEVSKNKGDFKIFVIKNHDWEKPLRIETAKSQKIISKKLENILSMINAL